MPCACVLSCFSGVQLFATLWTADHQASLSMGFFRQEYWSGLPCPSSGDFADPGIKPASPALQVAFCIATDSLLLGHQGSPLSSHWFFLLPHKCNLGVVFPWWQQHTQVFFHSSIFMVSFYIPGTVLDSESKSKLHTHICCLQGISQEGICWTCSSDVHDCRLPGSSVHGISQARILEWVAVPFFRGFC